MENANNPLLPVFASDGITYEFFVKAPPQGKDSYSGLLRSTAESDNFFSMVSDPYVGSGLQMRFVTYDPLSSSEQLWQTKCETSITRRDIVVFDDKWHHFAFGVVPDGTNTTVRSISTIRVSFPPTSWDSCTIPGTRAT